MLFNLLKVNNLVQPILRQRDDFYKIACCPDL